MEDLCALPAAGPAACISEREQSIMTAGKSKTAIHCADDSLAGSVSQRACVFCGARVVLNPVTDAVHLVHGPIGCATYTWDIRGSLSSGPEMYRNSFSTDMKERDVVFGGEKKLAACIDEIVEKYHPPAIFVYATCVTGMIGDDIIAVSKAASRTARDRCDPGRVERVHLGQQGRRVPGSSACPDAAHHSQRRESTVHTTRKLNFLGEYNLGGETWLVKRYLREMGIEINVAFTGDSTVAALKQAPGACLNLVQCTGSMHWVALQLEKNFGTPFLDVNFFGAENTAESLRKIARFYDDPAITARTEALIERELARIQPDDRTVPGKTGRETGCHLRGRGLQSGCHHPAAPGTRHGDRPDRHPDREERGVCRRSAASWTRTQSWSTTPTRPRSRGSSLR